LNSQQLLVKAAIRENAKASIPLGMGRAMSVSGTLRLIKMNTLEPLLTHNPGNLKVDGTLIARASRRTSVQSPVLVARKKRFHFERLIFLMPLAAVALIIYRLRMEPADVIRQEFEGFGVAICAAAYGGVLLWRVTRAMKSDLGLQTQPPTANPSPLSPSEPNLSKLRKIQSSLPPDAATAPAAPVASLHTEIRT
jgi:hypothetical protein